MNDNNDLWDRHRHPKQREIKSFLYIIAIIMALKQFI